MQTGVWYSPGLEFAAFDVGFATTDAPDSRAYLPFDDAMKVSSDAGFHTVPVLHRGSFASATAFAETKVRFPSKVPAMLGLPALSCDNFAEGVVLRHTRERGPATGCRPMIKAKIPEFSEDAYGKAVKAGAGVGAGVDVADGSPAATVVQAALAKVTPARVAAARSKVGGGADSSAAVVQEVCTDVLGELWEDHSTAMAGAGDDFAGFRPSAPLWEVVADAARAVMR